MEYGRLRTTDYMRFTGRATKSRSRHIIDKEKNGIGYIYGGTI